MLWEDRMLKLGRLKRRLRRGLGREVREALVSSSASMALRASSVRERLGRRSLPPRRPREGPKGLGRGAAARWADSGWGWGPLLRSRMEARGRTLPSWRWAKGFRSGSSGGGGEGGGEGGRREGDAAFPPEAEGDRLALTEAKNRFARPDISSNAGTGKK